jgi:glucokinase
MILAGDVGGTKTHLALFAWTSKRVEAIREETFHSADYQSLEDIVEAFLSRPVSDRMPLAETEEPADSPDQASREQPENPPAPILEAACFGVAGPVINNQARTTNLPWFVDGPSLGKQFNIKRIRLLNDLEATSYGALLLTEDEVVVLNAGNPPEKRQALALIAAGTGLGEAILFWDGERYRPRPSEGGHADFAPNSDSEIELLRHVRGNYLHVSYERVLSGPGLHAIYDYLRDTKKNEPTWLAEKIKVEDPAAAIAEAGLNGKVEIATQALDLFASIYGAEAGNLALKALALDGVYVAGGIAPKLIEKLKDGTFMRAFTNKGRYKRLMSTIPVKVVMNPKAGLLGAASFARGLVGAALS